MEPTYKFLPLGAVKPQGWLKRQLQIQANGLSGHLDSFWPDLGPDSGWLGGNGESWENAPYYLDGLVPLAYLLDDPSLIEKVQKWLGWILSHQHKNGWLGPDHDPHQPWHGYYDVWPIIILLKSVTQYYEAYPQAQILDAMIGILKFLDTYLEKNPLRNWGRFRWADLLLSIFWLYGQLHEPWLLDLARKIQAQGYDWTNHFSNFRFTKKVKKGEEGYDFRTHGVNNAMGIKAPGIWYLLTDDEKDRRAVFQGLLNLDQYHGQVTGVFSADGHLGGLQPIQGTELCAVVEYLFSLENLISIFGSPSLCDRLERVAYNALPAAFSPDMWSHQYDQQVNQVLCTYAPRGWTTNWNDSNIFGLEPSYSCCTANMHQGWPKFARSLWMSTYDSGFVAIAYAPCTLTARSKENKTFTIFEETDYPFSEKIHFKIQSDSPVQVPLKFRIPEWCKEATIDFAGERYKVVDSKEFISFDRVFNPGDKLTLELPMHVRAIKRPSGSTCLERGPLIYSLFIGEEWRKLEGVLPQADKMWLARVGEEWNRTRGEHPHADYEIYPTTHWNYGLSINFDTIEQSITVLNEKSGDYPFSPSKAPVKLFVMGRRIPDWGLKDNSAAMVPPVSENSHEPEEQLILIPYGCTNLRITEFPIIRGEKPQSIIEDKG